MCADPELRKRFEREAKVVAGLEHTHILPVHDYGGAGNRLYLAMRYIKAGTLQDRISAGPMDLAEVNDLFQQIGSALDYAHRLGIVHRDVKPANVLLDDQDGCYLTDFGLAKILASSAHLTASGVGLGTPAYMSPEQGQGDQVDARSDIYALGVVLYEMIAGQTPYRAETPMAVVLMHITAPLPPLRGVRPDAPEEVERVILKAMAKDTDDRFQTVREMMDALDVAVEAALSARPVELVSAKAPVPLSASPPPVSPPLKKAGWVWAAAGVAAVSVFCLVGLVVTLSFLPFKVQVRNGQVEVVQRTQTTPTLAPSTMVQEPKDVAVALATATQAPPRPTETLASQPTATRQSEGTATSTAQPTPTAIPPSPIPESVANVSVSLLALYEDAAHVIAWAPDGGTIVVIGHTLRLFDVTTLEQTIEIRGPTGYDIAFSPDGTTLAAASHDGVTLWDTSGWGKLRTLSGSRDSKSVAFSPDGKLLATGTGSTIKLWDVASGDELRTLPGSSGRAVAFSPDGQLLAASGGSAGQEVKLWDVASGDALPALQGHTNWINDLSFSPDGRLLASGSVDDSVRLWNVAEGRQVRVLTGHTNQVEGVSFSPDGKLLASASWDLTVKLWDVASGQELASLTGHTDWIQAVAFSPDGAIVASSAEMVRLWGLTP
jgi:eukaryotic-like serine/threonine-protein kinase